MTTGHDMAEFLARSTLDFVRQSQDAFVDAMRVWAESFERLARTPPPGPGTGTKPPKSPVGPTEAPNLPKPEEVLDQVFDFAENLLAAQREFAANVIHMSSQANNEIELSERSSEGAVSDLRREVK